MNDSTVVDEKDSGARVELSGGEPEESGSRRHADAVRECDDGGAGDVPDHRRAGVRVRHLDDEPALGDLPDGVPPVVEERDRVQVVRDHVDRDGEVTGGGVDREAFQMGNDRRLSGAWSGQGLAQR